jgi:hypothetical protein
MPGFDHWLVTRFNVPNAEYAGRSSDHVWLEHRLGLFRKYCLPSVAKQSCRRFTWLLLVDLDTPAQARDALLNCRDDFPFATLPVGDRWQEELAAFLASESREGHLLTSRLDSDDAIHRDYLGLVQEHFSGRRLEFLEFRTGLRLDAVTGKLYRVHKYSCPFLTLAEPADGTPLTVYCCAHPRADEVAPLRNIPLENAWLQVIHGGNLGNRIGPEHTPVSPDVLQGW